MTNTVDETTDNYLHYMVKADILRSTVEGTECTALCGETFVPHARSDGFAGASCAEICPPCLAEHAALQAEKSMETVS